MAILLALWFGAPSTAHAIPTPEMALPLVSDALLLLTILLTLLLGRKTGRKKRQAQILLLGALLGLSIVLHLVQFVSHREANQERLGRTLVRTVAPDGQTVHIDSRVAARTKSLPSNMAISLAQVDERTSSESPPLVVDLRMDKDRGPGLSAQPPPLQALRFGNAPVLRSTLAELVEDPSPLRGLSRPPILVCYSGATSADLAAFLSRRGIVAHFLAGGLDDTEGRARIPRATYPNRLALLDTPRVEELWDAGKLQFVVTPMENGAPSALLPESLLASAQWAADGTLDAVLDTLEPDEPVVIACSDWWSCADAEALGAWISPRGIEYLGRYTVPFEFLPETRRLPARVIPGIGGVLVPPLLRIHTRLPEGENRWGVAVLLFAVLVRLGLFVLRSGMTLVLRSRPSVSHASQLDLGFIALRFATNLLALLVLLWGLKSVSDTLEIGEAAFPAIGIPRMGQPAPSRLLPFLVATVFAGHILRTHRSRGRLLLAVVAGAVLVAVPSPFPIYGWLYVGSVLAVGLLLPSLPPNQQRREEGSGPTLPPPLVLGTKAHSIEGLPAKAARLGRIAELGIPVPAGAVLTPTFFAQEPELAERSLAEACGHAGAGPYAIRSAAALEDGTEGSFAGAFLTRLEVPREAVARAVEEVRASIESRGEGCVLIQEHIAAPIHGVLVTRAPHDPGHALVESTSDGPTGVTDGTGSVTQHLCSRLDGEVIRGVSPDVPLRDLVELGMLLESTFGAAQDIEWAWTGSKFVILQSRPIGRGMAGRTDRDWIERERLRVLDVLSSTPTDLTWQQGEISSSIRNPTRLSLWMLRRLYSRHGAAGQAATLTGLRLQAPPSLDCFFGRLFQQTPPKRTTRPLLAIVKSLLLLKIIEANQDELPEHSKRRRLQSIGRQHMAPTELDAATIWELTRDWMHQFSDEDYAEAFAATRLLEAEMDLLRGLANLAGAQIADLDLRGSAALEVSADLGEPAPSPDQAVPPSGQSLELAPRAVLEPEATLGSPGRRIDENPPLITGTESLRLRLLWPTLERCSARYRTAALAAEKTKRELLQSLEPVRRNLAILDQRLGLGGCIYHFDPDEITRLVETANPSAAAREGAQRAHERDALLSVSVPLVLCEMDVEDPGQDPDESLTDPPPATEAPVLARGTWSSVRTQVEGKARVLDTPAQLNQLEEGEILVTRFAEVGWTAGFDRASAQLTEVGGLLSHAAIIARERGFALMSGVDGATSRLHTGDLIRLERDGTVGVLVAADPAHDEKVGSS